MKYWGWRCALKSDIKINMEKHVRSDSKLQWHNQEPSILYDKPINYEVEIKQSYNQ